MRIRKNAARMSRAERDRFVAAVKALKHDIVGRLSDGTDISSYDELVALHLGVTQRFVNGNPVGDGAHQAPAFLPWHRQYLMMFEERLRAIDATVTVPYWDWVDADGSRDIVFQDDFMGPAGEGPGGEVVSGPFVRAEWPIIDEIHRPNIGRPATPVAPIPDNTQGPALLRSAAPNFGALPSPQRIRQILGRNVYEDTFGQRGFRLDLERDPHGRLHGWVGGTMLGMSSPNDPIFFLHHGAVDWIWARWQDGGHAGPDFYPQNFPGEGQALDSPMWPWDGNRASTHELVEPYLQDFPSIVRPAHVLDFRSLGFTYDTLLPLLEMGQPVSDVELIGPGDEQGFQVDVRDLGAYRLDKQGQTTVSMEVYGPDNWELVSAEAGAGMVSSVIEFNAPGNYFVVIRHNDIAGPGRFSLLLQELSPPQPIPTLNVDTSPVQATIDEGELDVYRFTVAALGEYTIETEGSTDVVMALYGPDSRNSLVTQDDDGGEGRNARIRSRLTAGEYYLEVRHFFPTGAGPYRISVRTDTPLTPIELEIDGPAVQREIGIPNESDLYTFQAGTDADYAIETSGPTDTFLTLYESNGSMTVIARDDDSGPDLLSRIQQDLEPGAYYVRVRHYSPSGTGPYGIRVRTE